MGLAAVGKRPSRLRKRIGRLLGAPSEPIIRLNPAGTFVLLCLLVATALTPA